MKKLILHIVIVICLFFAFDRTFGLGLRYLYRISNTTDEYKISYSNESTFDSLLFLGSSRCLHHYVPSVFEKELGTTCFNAADWGIKNIYYHYGLLGNILSRYTPKEIVFEVHPCDFLDTPYSGTERAGSLAPFCGMSDTCDEIDGILDTTGLVAEEYPFPIKQEKVDLLERFIRDCQQRSIRLSIIVSPMYICTKEDVYKIPRELAFKHQIPFIDHFRDSTFVGHPELFYDFGHLNRKGAIIYSEIISKELKR